MSTLSENTIAASEYVNGYKRLSPILRAAQHGKALQFWCPGCDDDHQVMIDDGTRGWTWNGDVNAPTFNPSVLIECLKTERDAEGRWNGNWVLKNGKGVEMRCHSFVRDGKIEFLPDCTHELAGQTLPLELWYTHETEGLPGRPKKG